MKITKKSLLQRQLKMPRIGNGSSGPQNVNVALSVDNQWVNGGQVEVADDRWHEIGGSFRIEKQPSKVMVYIQGPASGLDLMVAGLQIFAFYFILFFNFFKQKLFCFFYKMNYCIYFGYFVF